jgi:hypothetical protein
MEETHAEMIERPEEINEASLGVKDKRMSGRGNMDLNVNQPHHVHGLAAIEIEVHHRFDKIVRLTRGQGDSK